MGALRWLADFVYLLAGLIYSPYALYQAIFLGKNRHGWGERFGRASQFDPSRPRIWIHAVSLGEINATPKLVAELSKQLPDHDIVFSTTTDTGFARAVELYGRKSVFRFPLDFSAVIRRAFDRIRPSLILLVELEIWFNLMHEADRRGIPVVIVNGRLTERSARRFTWLGGLARSMFQKLIWVGAQDEPIAARFRALGTPPQRVEITGSVKWDTATISDSVPGADALARELNLDASQPIWVCGSTGPGEEEIVLDAYRKILSLDKQGQDENETPLPLARGRGQGEGAPSQSRNSPILILVPRKPERFDEVAALITNRGFRCKRRSNPNLAETATQSNSRNPSGETNVQPVVLGDTMGELRKFYSLAKVVFVGRSLVPMGGSDPMEVAALGKPILAGPHMENFAAPVEALRSADAIRIVHNAAELTEETQALLGNPAIAAPMGMRAQDVVRQNQGATRRTADRVVAIANNTAN